MIERVLSGLPGREVLDVGCGTGIEARQFQAAGCNVLGVEPDPRMAEFARATGVDVEVSTFETWDRAARQFDAVISGTAWHWVDPELGAEKAGQALRAGGRIAPFHHVFDAPPAVADAMSAAFRDVAPDSPMVTAGKASGGALTTYQPLFRRIAEGIRRAACFSEPAQWHFPWERSVTRDEWLDQMPTLGGMTRLDAAALATVHDRVGNAIDTIGDGFTVHYVTVVVAAIRK
jgi:SAM-dependent methyltransferase